MTITYTLEGLRPKVGPIVYVIRDAEHYLYVGMSRQGVSRVFAADHGAARKAMASGSHIDIIPCASANDARSLESRLIRQHKPKYNKADNPAHARKKLLAPSLERVADMKGLRDLID